MAVSTAPKRKTKDPDLSLSNSIPADAKTLNIGGQTLQVAPQQSNVANSNKGNTVKFNKDKTVTYNGQTISRVQYDAILASQGAGSRSSGKGAEITPEVQQAIEAQRLKDQGITPINPLQLQATQQSLDVAPPLVPGQTLGDNALQYGTAAGAGAGAAYAGFQTGAAIGTAIAPGIGTAVGAVVGTAAGLAAFGGKLSFDERQQTKEAYKNYNNAVKGLAYAQALANSGNSQQAVELWRIHKRNLLISQAQLKEKTKGAVGRQLSGAMEEYSTVNDYIDNYLPSEELAFAIALQNPNPARSQAYLALATQPNENQN